ncbi:uncharacterized protein N7496_001106 [Penicillium cataractarum]|uniref:Zn(2)-C6 fungal-type domain-containing protein n=1 Tax=Penicillium cataractarum TaxID=2100454 RepID=A0A9W9VVF8_9EURO|nr:uncharacterized protein N7496_001106 [Penicillium cataractarum]KAJ5390038.1 hypothetical protein N7496_001106 [Penicillium cataractarum]
MSEARQIPRNRRKTRSGCLRCKQRKIKCDEALPHCNQCTRRALDCPGYERPLKWSSKYETWNSADATKESSANVISSERDLTNNAKEPENNLSKTSTKLSCIRSPSLSQRGHVSESNYQRHTTGGVPMEDDFTLDPDKLLGPLIFSRPSIDEFFYDTISQSQALDTTLWDDLLIPSPQIAEDQSTRLSRHYFSSICRINCCFDSSKNPFRGWHNPSVLGITHLHGARGLYKKWLIRANNSVDTAADQHKLSHVKTFLNGTMAYWEAMASFVMDQPVQSISYLTPICDQTGAKKIQSNPWTGISTPVFVYLAQAGALGRQRSIIRKLSVSNSTTGVHEKLHEDLLAQACDVETALLGYKTPSIDRIEDTGDALTPVSHLQKMAQVYRLTALLEIYRVFPELLQKPSSDEANVFDSISFQSRTIALAIGILTIISTIPETSGVNALLCLPMITAGSALQPTEADRPELSHGSTRGSLCSELMSIFIQNDAHARWREFVRERMNIIHNYVGLGGVARALEVIEKTWFRADVQVFANEPDSVGEFVHWTDVMADERLETIFG